MVLQPVLFGGRLRDDPRPGVWQRKPQKPRLSYLQVFQIWHTPIQLTWVVALINRWSSVRIFAAWVWMAFMVLGFAGWLLHEYQRRRRHTIDDALSERPAGLEEFPVEVTLHAEERGSWADRGVIYFEKGRMGFAGTTFSFLLAAEDLDLREGLSWLREGRPGAMKLRTDNVAAFVHVKPILGYIRAYRRALREFVGAAESVSGDRQWPPLILFAPSICPDPSPYDLAGPGSEGRNCFGQ